MAGAAQPYDHLPFFYSDLFDLGYEAVGQVDSRLETVEDWQEPNLGKGVVTYVRGRQAAGCDALECLGQGRRRARGSSAPAVAPLRSDTFARSRKRRNGYEVLCEAVFRPLAHPLVLALARMRVLPPAVVAAAGVAGIAGAVEIGRGSLVVAALLLQVKTVLDNADGQLARLTGRTSAFGRYLDSDVDLLVNATLFAAVGWRYGQPVLAAAGFLALTSVLSLNFNASRLSRHVSAEPDNASDNLSLSLVRGVYRALYRPQDRLAEWIVARRPSLVSRSTVTVLANLGMSTQLALFGLFLVLGHPLGFAWLAIGELAVITLGLVPQRPVPVEETA